MNCAFKWCFPKSQRVLVQNLRFFYPHLLTFVFPPLTPVSSTKTPQASKQTTKIPSHNWLHWVQVWVWNVDSKEHLSKKKGKRAASPPSSASSCLLIASAWSIFLISPFDSWARGGSVDWAFSVTRWLLVGPICCLHVMRERPSRDSCAFSSGFVYSNCWSPGKNTQILWHHRRWRMKKCWFC